MTDVLQWVTIAALVITNLIQMIINHYAIKGIKANTSAIRALIDLVTGRRR